MKSISLKAALRANSVFSIMCAAGLLLFSTSIAQAMGDVAPWILQGVGVALVLWAISLVWVSSRPVINQTLVKGIVVADLGWVLGTAILLIELPGVFSALGSMMLAGVAFVVLVIALLQAKALATLNPQGKLLVS
jgi:hypothetical protein